MLTGNILITGGSGTLGHAIVRTAEREGWDATFTIYSRSELRQAQMRVRHPKARYILGDVRDFDRLSAAIAGHDLVIHAAAMKRIPEAEQQPQNCYEVNVRGSVNVARACLMGGVKTAIAISTDKACRTITNYGASKLLMEGLWRVFGGGVTRFIAVRYGNVVASNGSVIPLWRAKAARGEPLPITDKRCTRFWMAPSDAVKLIEWADRLLLSGQIAVPKMGALSLPELADIVAPGAETIETGLRSCEKIHEDLVHEDEPAIDSTYPQNDQHYVIGASHWWATNPTLGHAYTSDTAPRLTRDQFLAMLTEAESYD